MPIIRVENWLSVEWKYRVAPESCGRAWAPGFPASITSAR